VGNEPGLDHWRILVFLAFDLGVSRKGYQRAVMKWFMARRCKVTELIGILLVNKVDQDRKSVGGELRTFREDSPS